MKIALLLTNCGFCPSHILESARAEMRAAFSRAGAECLTNDETLTRCGAIETTADGMAYAAFLEEHRGEYDGLVIMDGSKIVKLTIKTGLSCDEVKIIKEDSNKNIWIGTRKGITRISEGGMKE